MGQTGDQKRVVTRLRSFGASTTTLVIPAEAGTQSNEARPSWLWVPAFAGMTANFMASG